MKIRMRILPRLQTCLVLQPMALKEDVGAQFELPIFGVVEVASEGAAELLVDDVYLAVAGVSVVVVAGARGIVETAGGHDVQRAFRKRHHLICVDAVVATSSLVALCFNLEI